MGGSSPLARGLPVVLDRDEGVVRIIPARAGFTTSSSAGRCRCPDHPRPRGVYSAIRSRRFRPTGSSPLARGLPCRAARSGRVLLDHPRSRGVYAKLHLNSLYGKGSSPLARGLPSGRFPIITFSQDHPRSRGVYRRHPRRSRPHAGSSPLARGLRQVLIMGVGEVGIIPARAGFTWASCPTTRHS